MAPLLQYILDFLQKKHPPHTARLESAIDNENVEYASKAASSFTRYKAHTERRVHFKCLTRRKAKV